MYKRLFKEIDNNEWKGVYYPDSNLLKIGSFWTDHYKIYGGDHTLKSRDKALLSGLVFLTKDPSSTFILIISSSYDIRLFKKIRKVLLNKDPSLEGIIVRWTIEDPIKGTETELNSFEL